MLKINIEAVATAINETEAYTYVLLQRKKICFSEKNATQADKIRLLEFIQKYRKL